MSNEEKLFKMKEYLEKFLNRNVEEDESESEDEEENSVDQEMLLYLLKSHLLLCKTLHSSFS